MLVDDPLINPEQLVVKIAEVIENPPVTGPGVQPLTAIQPMVAPLAAGPDKGSAGGIASMGGSAHPAGISTQSGFKSDNKATQSRSALHLPSQKIGEHLPLVPELKPDYTTVSSLPLTEKHEKFHEPVQEPVQESVQESVQEEPKGIMLGQLPLAQDWEDTKSHARWLANVLKSGGQDLLSGLGQYTLDQLHGNSRVTQRPMDVHTFPLASRSWGQQI